MPGAPCMLWSCAEVQVGLSFSLLSGMSRLALRTSAVSTETAVAMQAQTVWGLGTQSCNSCVSEGGRNPELSRGGLCLSAGSRIASCVRARVT